MEHPVLTDEALGKMATHRLIGLLRLVGAKISHIENYYGRRCCEICCEYIGNNWEEDVGQYVRPLREYRLRIKQVLSTREDSSKKPKWRRHKKAFRGQRTK